VWIVVSELMVHLLFAASKNNSIISQETVKPNLTLFFPNTHLEHFASLVEVRGGLGCETLGQLGIHAVRCVRAVHRS
jgi:hypothetical protein